MSAAVRIDVDRVRLALTPLRAALLAHAHAEADRLVAAATEEAARAVEAARAEVEEQVALARKQGDADARALLRLERGRIEQENQATILRAQRRAYDQLAAGAADAVRVLLREPASRALLDQRLREQLGPTATIRDTDDGGRRGECPDGSAVDASVAAIVERALARLDLEDLWTVAG